MTSIASATSNECRLEITQAMKDVDKSIAYIENKMYTMAELHAEMAKTFAVAATVSCKGNKKAADHAKNIIKWSDKILKGPPNE